MSSEPRSKLVKRPTEEKALSIIAREAAKLGLTQAQYMERLRIPRNTLLHTLTMCTCPYCRRKRLQMAGEYA